CMNITSSAAQDGTRLNLICTVWHKKEEAEGFIVFLCKDRSGNCSPETSLRQLRLKRYPGIDGVGEVSSQLVFTISQVTPSDSGTYQCCARSQKSDIRLQGHFFSILVTETGNYTVTGSKRRHHLEFGHSDGTLSSGFLQEKVWVLLVTSLVALQGMSRRAVSTPSYKCSIIFLPPWLFSRRRRLERKSRGREKCSSRPGYPQESSNQFP
uniref:CD160 antigen n=2 Tax=Saimiri boliviensis TaxID=27679 RepID=A0A2K6S8P1_SAIBB